MYTVTMATASTVTGEPREVPRHVLSLIFDMDVPIATAKWGEIVFERTDAEELAPGQPLVQIDAWVDIVPHPRDMVSRLSELLSYENGLELLDQILENELWRISYTHLQTMSSFIEMGVTEEGQQQIINDISYEIGRRVTNELSKSLTAGSLDSEDVSLP